MINPITETIKLLEASRLGNWTLEEGPSGIYAFTHNDVLLFVDPTETHEDLLFSIRRYLAK